MKKMTQLLVAALVFLGTAAFAEGDVTKGEKDYKKCKACHMIKNGDEVIFKGGKTGPNLFDVVGRQAGTIEGYKYSKSLSKAGEAGLIWNEELLVEYIQNPKAFLQKTLDDGSAKAKMTFKMKKPENVVAYLTTLSE